MTEEVEQYFTAYTVYVTFLLSQLKYFNSISNNSTDPLLVNEIINICYHSIIK